MRVSYVPASNGAALSNRRNHRDDGGGAYESVAQEGKTLGYSAGRLWRLEKKRLVEGTRLDIDIVEL